MRRTKLLTFLSSGVTLLFCVGCGGLFFYPEKDLRLVPDSIGLAYEDVEIQSTNGKRLHGWYLPPHATSQGTVLFLHGNAENISTHISSVHWLPREGFGVLLIDYQGYGKSEGSPSIDRAIEDVAAALQFLLDEQSKYGPIAILGQSLGGALAVGALANNDMKNSVCSLIIDSAFCDYRDIAREKLSEFWLTWPFQYPLSWLVPNSMSPEKKIASLTPLPILIMHGENDPIVPAHHSQCLFSAASEPKFIEVSPGEQHISSLRKKSARTTLLAFLDATCLKQDLPDEVHHRLNQAQLKTP